MDTQKNQKKVIRAWTFYDWANSVFPLIITSAIFPNFYDYVTTHVNNLPVGDTLTFLGMQIKNQDLYSYVYSFALCIVVLIVPVLSGVADLLGNKKKFLQFFCLLGALSCMALFGFNRDNLLLSFIPFITATIGFWGSLVFYNSYLPEIATPDKQDSVSAKGFAMGYLGSSLLLIVCLIAIIVFKMPAKFSFLLVGFWWIGFAQYTFFNLPNTKAVKGKLNASAFASGFKELKKVFAHVRKMPVLKRFLWSYFFYNMGVQTVMVMAVLFARKEITWPDEQTKTNSLIVSILLIQFLGIAGSFIFSALSRKSGNYKSLLLAIFIWIGICVYTYGFVFMPMQFYIVAASVGLVMGGIQALSRSSYSKLLPENTEDPASFFSFYDVMEKVGMIIGTTTFGLISQLSGGMRNAVLALISYFIIGLVLLLVTMKKAAHTNEIH